MTSGRSHRGSQTHVCALKRPIFVHKMLAEELGRYNRRLSTRVLQPTWHGRRDRVMHFRRRSPVRRQSRVNAILTCELTEQGLTIQAAYSSGQLRETYETNRKLPR